MSFMDAVRKWAFKKLRTLIALLLALTLPLPNIAMGNTHRNQAHIFVGYLDDRPSLQVQNSSVVQNLVSQLAQRECPHSPRWTCLWRVKSQVNERGLMEIKLERDGNEITIFSGAYSGRDDLNQNIYRSQQDFISLKMKEIFFSAFSNRIDFVYIGHSRYGYGPDFFPPVLSRSGEIQISHYRKHIQAQTSILNELQNLTQGANSPQRIAFFSCDSANHFESAMKKKFPRTSFEGSTKALEIHEAVERSLFWLENKFSNP